MFPQPVQEQPRVAIVGDDVFIIKLPFALPVESDFIVFLG